MANTSQKNPFSLFSAWSTFEKRLFSVKTKKQTEFTHTKRAAYALRPSTALNPPLFFSCLSLFRPSQRDLVGKNGGKIRGSGERGKGQFAYFRAGKWQAKNAYHTALEVLM